MPTVLVLLICYPEYQCYLQHDNFVIRMTWIFVIILAVHDIPDLHYLSLSTVAEFIQNIHWVGISKLLEDF